MVWKVGFQDSYLTALAVEIAILNTVKSNKFLIKPLLIKMGHGPKTIQQYNGLLNIGLKVSFYAH